MRYIDAKQQLFDAQKELSALWAAIEARTESITEDEKARDDALNAKIADLKAEVERIERAQANTAAAAEAEGTGSRISGGHDRFLDKPWGPEIPANASDHERTKLMEIGLGNFLGAVAQANTPGGGVDPRLIRADVSGASSGVPSDGGYFVRTDYSDFLLGRGIEQSMLAPMCDTVPIGENSDGLEAPMFDETSRATGSRWGGVRVYRAAEADTVTATKPKFGKFDLRLEDLMGLAYATDRLLRDATQIGAIFARAFASEFAFKIDDEIVRGSGAGECLGILNAGATVSQAKETGQAADTVVANNLSKMWARLHARSRGNAVWLYNQELEPQLDQLSIVMGTAGASPHFVTYGPDGVLRIKGRPVRAIEQASAPGDVGDIMLVNLGEYVLITKGGIQADESMHVRFIYNERTFRWVYRINGQPKWADPLTPYKGSATATQSPFITLAAR